MFDAENAVRARAALDKWFEGHIAAITSIVTMSATCNADGTVAYNAEAWDRYRRALVNAAP